MRYCYSKRKRQWEIPWEEEEKEMEKEKKDKNLEIWQREGREREERGLPLLYKLYIPNTPNLSYPMKVKKIIVQNQISKKI
jgi:hypothetical protein